MRMRMLFFLDSTQCTHHRLPRFPTFSSHFVVWCSKETTSPWVAHPKQATRVRVIWWFKTSTIKALSNIIIITAPRNLRLGSYRPYTCRYWAIPSMIDCDTADGHGSIKPPTSTRKFEIANLCYTAHTRSPKFGVQVVPTYTSASGMLPHVLGVSRHYSVRKCWAKMPVSSRFRHVHSVPTRSRHKQVRTHLWTMCGSPVPSTRLNRVHIKPWAHWTFHHVLNQFSSRCPKSRIQPLCNTIWSGSMSVVSWMACQDWSIGIWYLYEPMTANGTWPRNRIRAFVSSVMRQPIFFFFETEISISVTGRNRFGYRSLSLSASLNIKSINDVHSPRLL